MKNFLKISAAIIAVLFVGSTALAFMLYNVEQGAFDAELYIQALEDENFYQRLPDLAARSLTIAAQQPGRSDFLSLLKNTSEDEWRVFVSELLPPDVLRSLAQDAARQVMAYLNGESDDAILSLAGLKAHLLSPEGVDAVYGILRAQPDCTVEQLAAMALNQQALTLCNPPDSFLFVDLRPIIKAQIQGSILILPEQVTLIHSDESRIQTLRDLRALRLFMRLSPILPILCLLALTALAVRSLNDWLTWWGYPLFLAGLLSMTLGVLSGPMAALTFRFFIASVLPNTFSPEITGLFRDLTATIVRNAVQPILPVAGLLALIGLIMVALTFLLRMRSNKTI